MSPQALGAVNVLQYSALGLALAATIALALIKLRGEEGELRRVFGELIHNSIFVIAITLVSALALWGIYAAADSLIPEINRLSVESGYMVQEAVENYIKFFNDAKSTIHFDALPIAPSGSVEWLPGATGVNVGAFSSILREIFDYVQVQRDELVDVTACTIGVTTVLAAIQGVSFVPLTGLIQFLSTSISHMQSSIWWFSAATVLFYIDYVAWLGGWPLALGAMALGLGRFGRIAGVLFMLAIDVMLDPALLVIASYLGLVAFPNWQRTLGGLGGGVVGAIIAGVLDSTKALCGVVGIGNFSSMLSAINFAWFMTTFSQAILWLEVLTDSLLLGLGYYIGGRVPVLKLPH